MKIIQLHSILCAFNRNLITFSTVPYTIAPHFTLKFCDSITALVPHIVHLLGHLAGNWIGVSTGCNTKWGLATRFPLKCVKKKITKEKQTYSIDTDICSSSTGHPTSLCICYQVAAIVAGKDRECGDKRNEENTEDGCFTYLRFTYLPHLNVLPSLMLMCYIRRFIFYMITLDVCINQKTLTNFKWTTTGYLSFII